MDDLPTRPAAKRRKLNSTNKTPSAAVTAANDNTDRTRTRTRGKASSTAKEDDDDNDDAAAVVAAITTTTFSSQRNAITPSEVDIYDDIDGAHSAQHSTRRRSSLVVARNTPVEKKKTKASKKNNMVDPLPQNRKLPAVPTAAKATTTTTTTTASSSPYKKPLMQGFFKQFHASPTNKQSPTSKQQQQQQQQKEKEKKTGRYTVEKQRSGEEILVESVNGATTLEGLPEQQDSVEDEEEDDDEGDDEIEVTPVRSSSRARRLPARYNDKRDETPGQHSANVTPRSQKRSFKDKIRDLQEINQSRKAANGGADGVQQAFETQQTITELSQKAEPIEAKADHVTKENMTVPVAKTVKSSLPKRKPVVDEERPAKTKSSPQVPALPDHPPLNEVITTISHTRKDHSSAQDATFTTEQLQVIQDSLLSRFTSGNSIRLTHLDNEFAKVSSLVEQTIVAGESNSMLIIGARGSGKSTLVTQILQEQTQAHPADFHVVRLNGFIHTDDKLAVREIWRQLGRDADMDEEDSNAPTKNIADTLTTLLALLSDPAEQGREQEAGRITKSVIFILDEFELFASHPRQTLLYNLFDIAQSRKAPIAVLGLTARIDVAEALEKRVKSRFSHRYVHLSLSKSFTGFQDSCRALMLLSSDDIDAADGARGLADDWNAFIDQLLSLDLFTNHLQRLYHTTKSISTFQTSLWVPVATMPSSTQPTSTSALLHHFTTIFHTLQPPDSKLSLLSSLSNLHLALLICAARLTAIHAIDAVSFAEVYEEYKTLTSKAKIQASAAGALGQGAAARMWGKEVARNVWQELEQSGLVIADTGSANAKSRVDVGLEEIGMSGVELGAWSKWCKEI